MKKAALFFFTCSFLQLNAQLIPASRVVDWTHAGYEGIIPDPPVVIDITSFGAVGDSITDNYPFVFNAINSLSGNRGVIYFPPGNYLFQSTVTLPDSIVIRGASADSTHLIFDLAGVAGNSITISGSANFSFTNVLKGFNKGSSFVVVGNPAGFTSGDYAEIQEENGAWDTQPVSWADHSVGQIIQVNSISGDTLYFSLPLRIKYDSSMNVQIRKFIPAKEIGIECLTISRRDSVGAGVCFNIYFDHAVNCWIRGVESSRSIGSHIEVDASAHLEMTGNYLHHAFAYDGTSTHGYGITLFKHTGDCKLENNIMRHLRHSFSLQCGANGNVIAYNYSIDPNRSEPISDLSADISLHGHYAFANLFEGNIVQNIMLDQTWGPSGPFNTFFRNRTELYGILMTSGTVNSDSENFVGNEIPNTGALLGNYFLAGNGHFEFGNNVLGVITPAGTTSLNDSSDYLTSTPAFWNIASSWPTIGEPNVSGSGSIPAKERYASGIKLTGCNEAGLTGITWDEISDDNLLIYPDPACSFIYIKWTHFSGVNLKLCLADVFGKKIMEKNLPVEDHFFKIEIPEHFKAGIYFLTLQSEQRKLTRKIILNPLMNSF